MGESSRLAGGEKNGKGSGFSFFSSSSVMTPCRLTLCCSFIVFAVRQPVLTAKAKVSPKDTEWGFFSVMCVFSHSVCQALSLLASRLFHYNLLSEEGSCVPLRLHVLGMCATSLGWCMHVGVCTMERPVHLLHGFCLHVGVTSSLFTSSSCPYGHINREAGGGDCFHLTCLL